MRCCVCASSGLRGIARGLNGATLTVTAPPAFTTQPANQNVATGANLTLSVVANGSGTLTYQWLKNGANIAGATSASYTITGAQGTHAGTYSVVVTNAYGSTTSNGGTLTVNSPPTITTQPTSQTVVAGRLARFSVVASGSGTLTYQWRKGGVNIAQATSASYTISNAQSSHAGSYSVVVSNSAGNATSNAAVLTVLLQKVPYLTLPLVRPPSLRMMRTSRPDPSPSPYVSPVGHRRAPADYLQRQEAASPCAGRTSLPWTRLGKVYCRPASRRRLCPVRTGLSCRQDSR